MPAPRSGYEPIVTRTFGATKAATRSDVLHVCCAGDVNDDLIDGFDALREGVTCGSTEEVGDVLHSAGQLDE